MRYNEMTVEELRKETKKRGMPLQKDGKKFRKAELVERLESFDKDAEEWAEDLAGEQQEEKKEPECVFFAETFGQICKKYGGTVSVKDCKNLSGKDIIVFIDYVEIPTGEIKKKIRSAMVNRVSRAGDQVEARMYSGTVVTVQLEDILHIRKEGEELPIDIRKFMRKHRTKSGRELLRGLRG